MGIVGGAANHVRFSTSNEATPRSLNQLTMTLDLSHDFLTDAVARQHEQIVRCHLLLPVVMMVVWRSIERLG